MADVIRMKFDLDFTGSNGGKDIPCVVFDGEPTAEQQAECAAQGYGMQWVKGATVAPAAHENYERANEISLSLERIFWMGLYIFFALFLVVTAYVVGEYLLFGGA